MYLIEYLILIPIAYFSFKNSSKVWAESFKPGISGAMLTRAEVTAGALFGLGTASVVASVLYTIGIIMFGAR